MHFIFSPNFYISQFCLKILNNQNYLTKCCKVSHKFWKNFTKASPVLSTIITSISIQKIFQQANPWKFISQVFLDSPITNFFLARLEVFLHLQNFFIRIFLYLKCLLDGCCQSHMFLVEGKEAKRKDAPEPIWIWLHISTRCFFSIFAIKDSTE